jgi:hypothetical protein
MCGVAGNFTCGVERSGLDFFSKLRGLWARKNRSVLKFFDLFVCFFHQGKRKKSIPYPRPPDNYRDKFRVTNRTNTRSIC